MRYIELVLPATQSERSPTLERIRRGVIAGALLLVGLLHLLPVAGALGAEQLEQLYGLPLGEPNLLILLRHRAVLFGLLGLLLVVAAARPGLQGVALLAGAVSVSSFIAIAYAEGSANAAVARVVRADWVALGLLALAAVLHLRARWRR